MRQRVTAALASAMLLLTVTPARALEGALGADVAKPAAAGEPWTGAAVAALRGRIDALLAGEPALRGAHAGLLAVDTRDGRVLYARGADDAFAPASTLKLVTGIVALDTLGPAARFRTDVVADGSVRDGTLTGSLVLRGGGDPLLAEADIDDAARAVAASGIARVERVEIDDTHGEAPSYPPGWSVDDLAYGYAALPGALAYEHDAVRVTIAPGAHAGDLARVTVAPFGAIPLPIEGCTPTADVAIIALARTAPATAGDTIDLVRERAGCIDVVGAIPAGAAPETLDAAVPSPALFARTAFVAALARHGVTLLPGIATFGAWPIEFRHDGALAPSARTLWSHDSEPLTGVLAATWQPSDNLAAEMLLREIGARDAGPPGTVEHGIAAERRALAALGVGASAYDIVDGSGLSTYDRLTPRAQVAVLRHAWDGPQRDAVLDALPIAGVRGTLAASFTGTAAERRVFAKSGTLRHTAALAGYVASARHAAIAFAFDVDDALGDTSALRALRGRVLAALVQG